MQTQDISSWTARDIDIFVGSGGSLKGFRLSQASRRTGHRVQGLGFNRARGFRGGCWKGSDLRAVRVMSSCSV